MKIIFSPFKGQRDDFPFSLFKWLLRETVNCSPYTNLWNRDKCPELSLVSSFYNLELSPRAQAK